MALYEIYLFLVRLLYGRSTLISINSPLSRLLPEGCKEVSEKLIFMFVDYCGRKKEKVNSRMTKLTSLLAVFLISGYRESVSIFYHCKEQNTSRLTSFHYCLAYVRTSETSWIMSIVVTSSSS
jgi:hypothetical protein